MEDTPYLGLVSTCRRTLRFEMASGRPGTRRFADRTAGLGAKRLFVDLERRWRLSLPAVGLVADLGCGPALDGLRFARAGYQVIGIDLSSGMLRIACEYLPGRVAQGDLRALPVRPASLAGIWCVAALLHVPEEDTPAVLGELYRSLLVSRRSTRFGHRHRRGLPLRAGAVFSRGDALVRVPTDRPAGESA